MFSYKEIASIIIRFTIRMHNGRQLWSIFVSFVLHLFFNFSFYSSLLFLADHMKYGKTDETPEKTKTLTQLSLLIPTSSESGIYSLRSYYLSFGKSKKRKGKEIVIVILKKILKFIFFSFFNSISYGPFLKFPFLWLLFKIHCLMAPF